MTKVTLHGKNGQREVEITTRGFSTRHVKATREAVPSIFSPDLSLNTPEPAKQTTTDAAANEAKARVWDRVQAEINNPLGDKLKSLISECDSLLKPLRSPAAQAQMDRCFCFLNDRDSERKLYEKHNNVIEKREIAMKRLAEIQEVENA